MVNSCAHTTHDGNPSKKKLESNKVFVCLCTCVCADYYEMTRRKMSGGGGLGEKKKQNSLAEK